MPDLPSSDLPKTIPVMVLPCTLFPHALMPLFIFEPRYRAMLDVALGSDRFFCVGTTDPEDSAHEDEERRISPISTAGIVRACVTHEDGTSHLLLLGVQRIRFVDWMQITPFRIARIESAECETESPSLAEQLAREVIDITTALSGDDGGMSREIHDHLRTLDDPGMVADLVAHSFVTDPRQRQQLLETLDTGERLRRLARHLHARLADQS